MYGLNAVALVFFGCINVAAYQLCKCPEGRAELSCVGCAPCFFPAICCGMASFTRLSKAS